MFRQTAVSVIQKMIYQTAPLQALGDKFVWYLYASGELECGQLRATDTVWSLDIFTVSELIDTPRQPARYRLGPSLDRSEPLRLAYVQQELQVVSENTKHPTRFVLIC